ncbi:periplasmic heavy metal sensor [Deferrisoma sp.]
MNTRRTHRWIPFLTLGAALLLAAVPAWAGGGRRGGPPDPDRQLTHLTRYLDLTEDQQAEVRKILEGAHQKRQEIWDKEEGCRAEVRDEMEALREDTHERIATVLTDEQREAWKDLLEDFGPGRRHRGPGPRW